MGFRSEDEDALLTAVLARPEDDAPRLVLADWLEETGDPRGEFIQVQMAIARIAAEQKGGPKLAELHRREREVLQKHEAEIAGRWSHKGIRWRFRRGLPAAFGHVGFLRTAPDPDSRKRESLRFYPNGVGVFIRSSTSVRPEQLARSLEPSRCGNPGTYRIDPLLDGTVHVTLDVHAASIFANLEPHGAMRFTGVLDAAFEATVTSPNPSECGTREFLFDRYGAADTRDGDSSHVRRRRPPAFDI